MKSVSDVLESTLSEIRRYYTAPYFRHKKEIDDVSNLFSDEQSSELYKKEIVYCLLYEMFGDDRIDSFLGMMTPKQFEGYKKETLNCDFLKDPDIKSLFNEIDKVDKNLSLWFATTNFYLEQYNYNGIVKVDKGDVCLDAGGCFGDSALYFTKKGASEVYTFEIDKDNISFLEEIFRKLSLGNVRLINKAVSNVNSSLWYKP